MEQVSIQDRVTPFYFGAAEKQMLGLYYAPSPGQFRDFGVVLCHPLGQEFVRAHRALSQWAIRLARQGFPVLRFDYYGQGDSAGADEDGTLAQWQADLRSAIQELKRRGRVETVFLGGLRLGASLAALVASGRDDVEGLALWEPVIDGKAYLHELGEWHQEKLFYFLSDVAQQEAKTARPKELVGFGVAETLLAEIEELDLRALRRRPAGRLLVIESESRPAVTEFCEKLRALGAEVSYQLIESFKMWTEDPDKGLVPQPILQAAVDWIAREGA